MHCNKPNCQVKCHYCGPIYHDIAYGTAIIIAESESDFTITTDTHTLPLWASYGMSIVRILEKKDSIIMAPRYITYLIVNSCL